MPTVKDFYTRLGENQINKYIEHIENDIKKSKDNSWLNVYANGLRKALEGLQKNSEKCFSKALEPSAFSGSPYLYEMKLQVDEDINIDIKSQIIQKLDEIKNLLNKL